MGFRGRLLGAIAIGLLAGGLAALLARSSSHPEPHHDASIARDVRPIDAGVDGPADASVPADATVVVVDAGIVVDRHKKAHELDLVGQQAMYRKPIDTATAIRSFQESYDLDPVPRVLFNLATANYMAGNCQRARNLFEELLTKIPPDTNLGQKAKKGLSFKCE